MERWRFREAPAAPVPAPTEVGNRNANRSIRSFPVTSIPNSTAPRLLTVAGAPAAGAGGGTAAAAAAMRCLARCGLGLVVVVVYRAANLEGRVRRAHQQTVFARLRPSLFSL
jgi:hypothetical protein